MSSSNTVRISKDVSEEEARAAMRSRAVGKEDFVV